MNAMFHLPMRVVGVALLAMSPFACAPGPLGEDAESAIATEQGALVFCTVDSNCGPGEACCRNYCRPRVPSGANKLIAPGTDGSGFLNYGCYANAPSAQIPSPLARNLLPDFSWAGYKKGGVAIPNVYAYYTPTYYPLGNGNDDSEWIQSALNSVGAMTAGTTNIGAVVLGPGIFYLDNPLEIRFDGVVLRGAGQGSTGTVLMSRVATAHSAISVGLDSPATYPAEIAGTQATISGSLPVGVQKFDVTLVSPASCPGSCFAQGMEIVVVRTPNDAWINDKGMAAPTKGWAASGFVGKHPRTLTAATNLGGGAWRLTVDIPIVDPIEPVYGGGYVAKIGGIQFLERAGVEDLRIDATFEDTSTSDNDWNGILFKRVRNSWVRRVTVKRFGMSAVQMTNWSSFNTVEEVAHIEIKSPINTSGSYEGFPANNHRYSFFVNGGVGNFFQRCVTVGSRHSFVTGYSPSLGSVQGPHVWLDSIALGANADDGPHHRWATGLLYDNVRSEPSTIAIETGRSAGARVQNNGVGEGTNGHGWTGAQVMIWNSEGQIVADTPPAAMNWVVGGPAAQNEGNGDEQFGIWQLYNGQVAPRSLYFQQLKDRLGQTAVDNVATSAQLSGRIWNTLRTWLGNGPLSTGGANPQCSSGLQSGRTCCSAAPTCTQCGGSGCGNTGHQDECCNQHIVSQHRSCAQVPPPCEIPDPTCATGTKSGGLCCAGCSGCCGSAAIGRSCAEFPPPCIVPDRCTTGVPGLITALGPDDLLSEPEICCHSSCNQCGGPGCGTSPNTSANCCAGSIEASGRSCDTLAAPCIVN